MGKSLSFFLLHLGLIIARLVGWLALAWLKFGPSAFALYLFTLICPFASCFFIESFPQMCFEGKWLQNRLRADKMSRDHFWRSISRDTNVEVSALSPFASKCALHITEGKYVARERNGHRFLQFRDS